MGSDDASPLLPFLVVLLSAAFRSWCGAEFFWVLHALSLSLVRGAAFARCWLPPPPPLGGAAVPPMQSNLTMQQN